MRFGQPDPCERRPVGSIVACLQASRALFPGMSALDNPALHQRAYALVRAVPGADTMSMRCCSATCRSACSITAPETRSTSSGRTRRCCAGDVMPRGSRASRPPASPALRYCHGRGCWWACRRSCCEQGWPSASACSGAGRSGPRSTRPWRRRPGPLSRARGCGG